MGPGRRDAGRLRGLRPGRGRRRRCERGRPGLAARARPGRAASWRRRAGFPVARPLRGRTESDAGVRLRLGRARRRSRGPGDQHDLDPGAEGGCPQRAHRRGGRGRSRRRGEPQGPGRPDHRHLAPPSLRRDRGRDGLCGHHRGRLRVRREHPLSRPRLQRGRRPGRGRGLLHASSHRSVRAPAVHHLHGHRAGRRRHHAPCSPADRGARGGSAVGDDAARNLEPFHRRRGQGILDALRVPPDPHLRRCHRSGAVGPPP